MRGWVTPRRRVASVCDHPLTRMCCSTEERHRPAHMSPREILVDNADLRFRPLKRSALENGYVATVQAIIRYGMTFYESPDPCIGALLDGRAAMMARLSVLHRELLRVTANDELCRRFMTIPGVGPVTALAFKTAIDDPARFRRSSDVGAHLGLTPRQYQSGETDVRGRISRSGDAFTRTALFTAAHVMLTRSCQWTSIKAWGVRIAKRSSLKKAKIAVARKLAVVMHRMWRDATPFRWGAPA